jgi:type IV pilus assembly protein PilE
MRKTKGFTLIELMITVAIIAILAAIVIPSYADYIQRSKITEAVSTLSGMRQKMEQYFQDNRGYTNSCLPSPPNAVTVANQPVATANFTYACLAPPDATTYTVTATGINSMTGFIYTIDQNGGKTSTGPAAKGWPNSNICWILRKDGSC